MAVGASAALVAIQASRNGYRPASGPPDAFMAALGWVLMVWLILTGLMVIGAIVYNWWKDYKERR